MSSVQCYYLIVMENYKSQCLKILKDDETSDRGQKRGPRNQRMKDLLDDKEVSKK